MKNIKISDKFKRIIAGGLGVTLLASGFGLGRLSSTDKDVVVNEKYLADYIKQRDGLEKEIEKLSMKKQKLKNVETFDMKDLVVIESSNVDDESNLYILEATHNGGICREYHNDFMAWYRMHPHTDEHKFDFCIDYLHFDEYDNLFNYLTAEELESVDFNDGKITNVELDEILTRIRAEHQEKMSSNNLGR